MLNVLIVEDDKAINNLIRTSLADAGYACTCAFDGTEAADLIIKGLNGAIASKKVTYDFARLMEGAVEIKCSQFADNIIAHTK